MHTPGPWRFEVHDNGEWHIYGSEHPWSLFGTANYYPNVSDCEDDWHLIGAAPEMLASLKLVARYINGDLVVDRSVMLDQINALIAKAEGK